MPRYLHIPHTPDTARTLTLSGRNCLVVSGMTSPPPKTGYRRGKGRRGEMCPQGTQKFYYPADKDFRYVKLVVDRMEQIDSDLQIIKEA